MFNKVLDLLFRPERTWNARQAYSPVCDCSLTSQVLLPDCDDSLRLRDEQVHCEAGKDIRKDDVHPEIVGSHMLVDTVSEPYVATIPLRGNITR